MQAMKKTAFDYAPLWSDANVLEVLPDGTRRLGDGTAARVGASCLLAPQAGDRVLYAALASGETFILAVLERHGEDARLEIPGAREIRLAAPRLTLTATEAVDVQSLRDIELTAAAGSLRLNAHYLAMTVVEALVQNARQLIGQVEIYALKAKTLMRLHGSDAVVTAEREVKVDAERISLG